MKTLFPGYYRPIPQQLQELWKNCIFIFDTNVLLDLYRYPKTTRDELLLLFKAIEDRIWIPFQVALEYQENRVTVIAEQVRKYDEVQKVLIDFQNKLKGDLGNLQLKKRHSAIDPEKFLSDLDELIKSFLANVQNLKKDQPDIQDEDKLREQIDALFIGKIGDPPTSQSELEQLYTDGIQRYNRAQPPGYMDRPKGKDEKDIYYYGELAIKREYGDLLVWKQSIDEVIRRQSKYVIFVTNDEKEDWWQVYEPTKRILGPRRELIEEMAKKGGVSVFYMYNTERFLLYAKDYFKIAVSQESIEQIRDISRSVRPTNKAVPLSTITRNAEAAVLDWILNLEWAEDVDQSGFPDFVVTSRHTGERIGYEVKYFRDEFMVPVRVRDIMYRGYYEVSNKRVDKFNLVIILENETLIPKAQRQITRLEIPSGVGFIFGVLQSDQDENGVDKPKFISILETP